jgi:hypothetical protein
MLSAVLALFVRTVSDGNAFKVSCLKYGHLISYTGQYKAQESMFQLLPTISERHSSMSHTLVPSLFIVFLFLLQSAIFSLYAPSVF